MAMRQGSFGSARDYTIVLIILITCYRFHKVLIDNGLQP